MALLGFLSRRKNAKKAPTARRRLEFEQLEDRAVPALLPGQVSLVPPILETSEVDALLMRAAAATASDDAIIAVVDRMGNILGVRIEGGVSAFGGDQDRLYFAIDGAVAKARTAALFSSDSTPLTSRTIQFISQSTITQREVESLPYDNDPNSTERGPGYVAPIGVGGHFPPNVPYTPLVDLFGIEHTNRDSFVHPGEDRVKGTPDDIILTERFNATFDAGKDIDPPLSFGETIDTDYADPEVRRNQSRGIATLPGGIPIFEYGSLVGGIGVFFPGETGFATEENSSLDATYDPSKPDRTLEAEFIALAAVGGSSGAGFPVGALGGIDVPAGFDLPFGRIDLVGITLDIVGPLGTNGPQILVNYAHAVLGVGLGNPNSGTTPDLSPMDPTTDSKPGVLVPDGWLVSPKNGIGIAASDVQRIIEQGVAEANQVRAQIRLKNGDQASASGSGSVRSRMVLAVTDLSGEVVGLYRMPDATVFSIDVAVAKARNLAYYNDATQLQPVDYVTNLPAGTALTNRSFRYLANPRFPVGIEGAPPAPFSILNDPGINRVNGLMIGPALPASAYTSAYGFDSFFPGTNFHAGDSAGPFLVQNQNGVVFFPGSSGVYRGTQLIAGFGVSGDGVDQDDVVTAGGIFGYAAPTPFRVDQYLVNGIRLPYLKFPRNARG